jgi:hypothetical protein
MPLKTFKKKKLKKHRFYFFSFRTTSTRVAGAIMLQQ